jgi:serine/threonine protein kinase
MSASASSIEIQVAEDLGRMIGGRYRLSKRIGEGGMGVVYQAIDTHIDRPVAIKLMRRECLSDVKFITRFRRELEVTSQFRHPSTIRVYEHGETDDGRPYMVMELLTGESLTEALERGRIPEVQALEFAKQIAESLSEAHDADVFHRDLKPDNLFIETVGVTTVVKVLDFGIAGGADALKLTQAGEVFGTPQYMSPEQCNGQPLDHRTDIYSLGVILYEMIEGRPPFGAESPMATMLKHVRAKVPPPRYAHPATAKLLNLALRKDRTKRIQSAGRFAELCGQAIGVVRAAEEGRSPPPNDLLTGAHVTPPNLGGLANVQARASTSAPSAPAPSPRGASSPPLALILVVGVAVVAFAAFFLIGKADDPLAADAGADAPDPVQGTALPFNRPLITSNVEQASVFVDGQYQCTTPCEIAIPVGDDKAHEIRLKKDGYVDSATPWRPLSVSEPLPKIEPMRPLGGQIEVKTTKKKRGSP